MIKEVTQTHLGSIWYHSETSEVPYFTNRNGCTFLAWYSEEALEIINLQPFCSAMTPFVCLLRIKIHSMAWKNILGIASHYTAVICKLDDFIACSDLKIATVFVTTCVEYSTMQSHCVQVERWDFNKKQNLGFHLVLDRMGSLEFMNFMSGT